MQKEIFLFANWKMYLNEKESVVLAKKFAQKFAKKKSNIKMAVFPGALAFSAVTKVFKGHAKGGQRKKISTGAQNAHCEDKGGFTGEISMPMYKAAGAKYILVGHSERRHLFHETNHEVWQKLKAISEDGLIPVLCVGETLKEKEAGKSKEAVEIQLRAALNGIKFSKNQKLIIAYEPVWAVGTGKHCDPAVAQMMAEFINKLAAILVSQADLVILYGGSVRGDNLKLFIDQKNIDGVLVGGASAKLDTWAKIAQNAT